MLSTCSSYEKSNRLLSDSGYTIGDNIQKLERKLGRNTGKDTPLHFNKIASVRIN